ncbi:MAG: hypothetical protein ACKO3S_09340 [bacterium]
MIRLPRIPSARLGAVCATSGVALLMLPGVLWAALGVELMAMAFWLWARTMPERAETMARWSWLRRPAMALWLATALFMALPELRQMYAPVVGHGPSNPFGVPSFVPAPLPVSRDPMALLRTLAALAVLWAGLELMAALPLSRPFPDLTGPVRTLGPWLTALLPVTGFLVLWRQAELWTTAPFVREVATVALLLAALLAALRAYTRRSLTASLRWLVVFDSTLASLLVARDVVPGEIAALLWLGSAGGRLIALAAELRGQAVRRGPQLTRLWRWAGWVAGGALAWPLLCDVGFGDGRFHPIEFAVLVPPVFVASLLWLQRVVEAPERRAVARPEDRLPAISRMGALATLLAGPASLAWAGWRGFAAEPLPALLALAPIVLAWWPIHRARGVVPEPAEPEPASGPGTRDFALNTFHAVTAVERQMAGAIAVVARLLGAPARDLHSGDAQEYLLFLVGVAVLSLLLPLLR